MNRKEAVKVIENMTFMCDDADYDVMRDAVDMAIEALKAKCPTCKWCSDHRTSGTRCPIEEHYALPKDGFCHLYEQI